MGICTCVFDFPVQGQEERVLALLDSAFQNVLCGTAMDGKTLDGNTVHIQYKELTSMQAKVIKGFLEVWHVLLPLARLDFPGQPVGSIQQLL